MKTLLTLTIGLGAIVAALGIVTALKVLHFAYEVMQHNQKQQDEHLNWFGRKVKKIVTVLGC